jgi:hypothetical protein
MHLQRRIYFLQTLFTFPRLKFAYYTWCLDRKICKFFAVFLQIVNVARIEDKPVYRYRGVSLDTSRNFISVEGIKRVIDGLSYNKMNMFHWHLTDTHSFPMEVQGRPNVRKYNKSIGFTLGRVMI